ncbi:hypothetical protein CgunFtcFv8_014225 [Champsocephalus gunnari]|uniref:Uncharacterized protein n=1 Tax=Champsocephalus gunnari TaxID=52237 RepID=A0AAN8E2X7_CHAGU|nr:hypothetical protein CgunFtcFv8_014225 [Champsocephalus gunnari]
MSKAYFPLVCSGRNRIVIHSLWLARLHLEACCRRTLKNNCHEMTRSPGFSDGLVHKGSMSWQLCYINSQQHCRNSKVPLFLMES